MWNQVPLLIHFKDEETKQESYWIISQHHTTKNWLGLDLKSGCVPLGLMLLSPMWYNIATFLLIPDGEVFVEKIISLYKSELVLL